MSRTAKPKEGRKAMNHSSEQRKSRLGQVRKGRIANGKRFCFYGLEAVGKTSLAASAPNPVFIDVDDGSDELSIARYSFRDDERGHVPASMVDIFDALDDLLHGEHDYKTVVLDTVDAIEPLIWKFVCERDSGKKSNLNSTGKTLTSIESYGYGRGYVIALDQWRLLCHKLDQLRVQRKMHAVLLSHTQIRTFKNPEGEDYDRYQLKIRENAAAFLREWCDVVGYCCFEDHAEKLDTKDTRAKGFSTGMRLIMLERTAAFDAKTRLDLPVQVEMTAMDPWAPFREALHRIATCTSAQVQKNIAAQLERLNNPALTASVQQAVAAAGEDVATLSRYLNNLRRRTPEEGNNA